MLIIRKIFPYGSPASPGEPICPSSTPPLIPRPPPPLFPAKAGTQTSMQARSHGKAWFPAFAGMSENGIALRGQLKGPHLRSFPRPPPPLFPAKAGTQTSMQARSRGKAWFPAFAGMSGNGIALRGQLKGPHHRSFRVPTSAHSREGGNPDFHASPIPREGLVSRLRGHERKRNRLTRSIERPPPPLIPRPPPPLFPAKAGTQTSMQARSHGKAWFPAFAGMSGNGVGLRHAIKPPSRARRAFR